MTPLAHAPLPLATTSAFTPRFRLPDAHGKSMWIRAFERASRQGALRSGDAPAAGSSQSSPGTPSQRPAQASGASLHADLRGTPPQPTFDLPQGKEMLEAGGSVGKVVASIERHEEGGSVPQPASKPRLAAAAHERSPLRIHVEEHADGLAVWIGCDAQVAPAQIAALCDALKARFTSTPVAVIVCNGIPVHGRPTRFEENP